MNQTAESLWFVFYKDELLLEKEGNGTFAIPVEKFLLSLSKTRLQYTISPHWKEETAKPIPYPNLLKRQNNMQ